MKNTLLCLMGLCILTACADARDNTVKAESAVHSHYVATGQRVREWFRIPPKENPQPTPPNNSYCYKALQDVVCYNSPLYGQEGRMTGFQESTGVTSSVVPMDGGSQPVSENVDRNYLVAPSQPVAVAPMPPLGASVNVGTAPQAANSAPVKLDDGKSKKPVSLIDGN